jgi:hypothetical protein
MSLNHSPAIVTDGLVLCLDAANVRSYPKSGTTWSDLAGANDGTLTNMDFANNFNTDNSGNFTFDGASDFIDLGANIVDPFPITMCVWFRTTTTPSASNMIFAQANSTNANNYQIFQFYTDAKLYWQVRGGSSTTAQSISSTTLNDGIWHYAVGVSASSSNHKLYIDGVLDGSSTTSVGTSSPDTLRIGCWKRNNGSESNFYNGDVGLAQMYNRALTGDEVRQNYEATVGRYT